MAEAENEEIVRRGFDAWNRGDLDGMLELAHEDIEITLAGVFPDLERTYHGTDGFREFWYLFRDAWNQIWIELTEIDSHGDAVYAGTVFHGVGRDDIPVERPFHFAFRFRDGLVASYDAFSERPPARVAAGLRD